MRKIILGFILFSLLVTVSYVKSVRSERSRETFRETILDEAAVEQEMLTSLVDSLQNELEISKAAYNDSLIVLNEFIENNSDSLEYLLSLSEEEIKYLKESYEKKLKSIEKKLRASKFKPTNETKKKTQAQTTNNENKIISYYKNRYKELPPDLTEYERRVAISEIRQETLNKFKISLSYLNKIREKNKIEF